MVPENSAESIHIYWEYLNLLSDPATNDDNKFKAAWEMWKNFEVILSSPEYATFLDHMLPNFFKILQEGEPIFISENKIRMVRQLMLQMMLRIPSDAHLRPYIMPMLSTMLKLLEFDNEENALLCMKIIYALLQQRLPTFSPDIPKFIEFVESIYRELPSIQERIDESRPIVHVDDPSNINVQTLLKYVFTITPMKIGNDGADGSELAVTNNLIPKAAQSLKVLQNLPLIVLSMYQAYETENLHQNVSEFISLILSTITLEPSPRQRDSSRFHKRMLIDLIGIQIRMLHLVTHIVCPYRDTRHWSTIVNGILCLMTRCPLEALHLRKDLLDAAKRVMSSDINIEFLPYIESLFDEGVMLGRGWLPYESLRSLAYSTLAELVYEVRELVPFSHLARAVHWFSKHLCDPSLPSKTQTASSELLLNLIEEICQRSEVEDNNNNLSRELLIRMLEVVVLKFKTVAKMQVPVLLDKAKQTPVMPDIAGPQYHDVDSELERHKRRAYSVTECRKLVESLMLAAVNITTGCVKCRADGYASNKLHPKETLVFIRLVKSAFQALVIYTIDTPTPNAQLQGARSKDPKNVLKSFDDIFANLDPQACREIFSTTTKYMVERNLENAALTIVFSGLLSLPTTSPILTTYLLEHLLETMDDMGSNVGKSDVYLKLFQLVFTKVKLFPAKYEVVLRPYVHRIVNRSMELGMSAKKPYNYFLLLMQLFKVITVESHELLYQELLPILPNLVEGLVRLQSRPYQQHMKDLLVELCLIVPIRFFSITLEFPVLMRPLVSALNSNDSLVSVGYQFLELLIVKLQPDTLNEYVQPFRADLVQSLRILQRHSKSEIADKANRALRNLGDDNDAPVDAEPRDLEYSNPETNPPGIVVHFNEIAKSIDFPMEKVIDTATSALISTATEPFYREQCWKVIHCYLAASLRLDDDRASLYQFFAQPSFKRAPIPKEQFEMQGYKCSGGGAATAAYNNVQRTALTGLFAAASTEDLRLNSAFDIMHGVVRHYTMVAIAQQSGPLRFVGKSIGWAHGQDPMLLVDALTCAMGHASDELRHTGKLALALILDTASSVLGTTERACQLPLVDYLAEMMCSLCHKRAAHAKRAGCAAIKLLLKRVSAKWMLGHALSLVRALMLAMTGLRGKVSYGVVDVAKANLERMLRACVSPRMRELDESEALGHIVCELMRHVSSPHAIAREQAVAALRLLAELRGESVSEVTEPHAWTLANLIPRTNKMPLRYQLDDVQVGLLYAHAYCATLSPRLFSIDLRFPEDKMLFEDVLSLTGDVDSIAVRKSALRALAAFCYVPNKRQMIVGKMCAALGNADLREAAFQGMRTLIAKDPIDMRAVNVIMDPLMLSFDDDRGLSLDQLEQLLYLSKLFPVTHTVKMCEQLLAFVRKLGVSSTEENERKIVMIIEIFHQISVTTSAFIYELCQQIFKTEETSLVEHSSLFREPLMKILLRYPEENMELFMSDVYIENQQWRRYLIFLIKHKEGKPFRDILQNSTARIIAMLRVHSEIDSALGDKERSEIQHQAIRIVSVLIRFDEQWLSSQTQLMATLWEIWCNDDYHALHTKVSNDGFCHWKQPELIVKILLHFFRRNPNDIDLLFQLLRATTGKYIPDFQFLRDFLENTVAQEYTAQWKRKAFFAFVEHFTTNMSPELKAGIVQQILIPCFAASLKRGEHTELMVSAPMPYQDNLDDIISVFTTKIIDPENPLTSIDCVRIALIQLACLFVELAPRYIHDNSSEQLSDALKKIISFAWPCLRDDNCANPVARYHGHLLLSHAIAKFTLDEEIILQVFHSLFKADGDVERHVVQRCFNVVIPAIPVRMKDGLEFLTRSMRKFFLEDSHNVRRLWHVLQLVIRFQQLFYPMRHHLVRHLIGSIRRLGFSRFIGNRRLAVGVAHVIIAWEQRRNAVVTRNANSRTGEEPEIHVTTDRTGTAVAIAADSPGTITKLQADASKPIEATHANAIINFLLKFACQESDPVDASGEPVEQQLSRTCVALFKAALKLHCWPKPHVLELEPMAVALIVSLKTSEPNNERICIALELLTVVLSIMSKEQMLAILDPLYGVLELCILSDHVAVAVTRALRALLIRIMSVFPTDPINRTVLPQELKAMYGEIAQFVGNGLTAYVERPSAQPPTRLFSPIMILDAVSTNDYSCMSCLMPVLVPVLRRMVEDHLWPQQTQDNRAHTYLLILAMSLVKNRMDAMNAPLRESFISEILVGLIEGTQDVKVMKEIAKMLEDWVKNENLTMADRMPRLDEKITLMVTMMQNAEKRFPDDLELNARFLELVNHVYRDETLKASKLTTKLEPAFLSGLRCTQPHVRAKFFQVIDGFTPRRLYDRLMYITRGQSWDAIGPHYWIKQCIELTIVASDSTTRLQMSNRDTLLPSVNSLIDQLNREGPKPPRLDLLIEEDETLNAHTTEESMDVDPTDVDFNAEPEELEDMALAWLMDEQAEFLDNCKSIKTEQLLNAVAQLCHMDTSLAERVWLDTFPRMWGILDEHQQISLIDVIVPFVSSDKHVSQKDCRPSAIGTFVKALRTAIQRCPWARLRMRSIFDNDDT